LKEVHRLVLKLSKLIKYFSKSGNRKIRLQGRQG